MSVLNPGVRVVRISGSSLAESTQDESDAVADVHTFAAVVGAIEIANLDTTNALTAIVNGVTIVVPPEVVWGPKFVTGTASAEVTVTGATSYLLNRYS